MSYCPDCGTDFPEQNAPCAICGTPYTKKAAKAPLILPSYISGVIIGLVLLTTLGLLWLVAKPALVYDRGDFLKSSEISEIRKDLAAQRTEKVRAASLKLEEEMWWFSGLPGSIIAATYLQDHFRGKKGALEQAGEYAKKAHDREPTHISQYYLGIYYYEKNEFVLAEELFRKAYTGFVRRRTFENAPKSPLWISNLGVLLEASKEAESKGNRADLKSLSWSYLL